MKRTEFKRAPAKEPKRRQKKCAVCKISFEPRTMMQRVCGVACSIAHIEVEKARKLRKERHDGLAKLKRRADYLKEAQAALNLWIRQVRDKDEACISCEHQDRGQKFDAGHYISRGSRPNLALDERNLAKQCHWCNVHLSGNQILFRKGLVKRHGTEFVEALEADDTPRKYTITELQAIKSTYAAKVRAAKKEQQA